MQGNHTWKPATGVPTHDHQSSTMPNFRTPSDWASNTTLSLGPDTFDSMQDSTTNRADSLQAFWKEMLRPCKDLNYEHRLFTSTETFWITIEVATTTADTSPYTLSPTTLLPTLVLATDQITLPHHGHQIPCRRNIWQNPSSPSQDIWHKTTSCVQRVHLKTQHWAETYQHQGEGFISLNQRWDVESVGTSSLNQGWKNSIPRVLFECVKLVNTVNLPQCCCVQKANRCIPLINKLHHLLYISHPPCRSQLAEDCLDWLPQHWLVACPSVVHPQTWRPGSQWVCNEV